MTFIKNKFSISLLLYSLKFIIFPVYLFFIWKMFPYFFAYGFLGKLLFLFQLFYIVVEVFSVLVKNPLILYDSIQNFVSLLMYGYFILLFYRFKQFFGLYLSSSYLWYFRINILIGIAGILLILTNTLLTYRKILS